MPDLRITVTPKSAAQKRELSRAAKASGLSLGPWLLSLGLAAAKGRAAGQDAPAVKLQPFGPSSPIRTADDARKAVAPLVRSYDPD